MGLRGSLLCGESLRCGAEGTPSSLCGQAEGRARGGGGAPHAGGRGQGVGLRGTVLLGEARAGCLGRGRSPRQGVKDLGGAELLGVGVLLPKDASAPCPPPSLSLGQGAKRRRE